MWTKCTNSPLPSIGISFCSILEHFWSEGISHCWGEVCRSHTCSPFVGDGHYCQFCKMYMLRCFTSRILVFEAQFPIGQISSLFQHFLFSRGIHPKVFHCLPCLFPPINFFACWFHHSFLCIVEIGKFESALFVNNDSIQIIRFHMAWSGSLLLCCQSIYLGHSTVVHCPEMPGCQNQILVFCLHQLYISTFQVHFLLFGPLV